MMNAMTKGNPRRGSLLYSTSQLIVGAFCALFACGLIAAETHYVDNVIGKLDSSGNETYDGKAATVSDGHGPFFKIQNAVDAAAVGDTVKVAAGIYGDEQGYTARDASYNAMRLMINKSITLEGAGREKTFIRGALDATKGAENGYCGANSVGGILITADAGDTKIKSLTLCTCSQSLNSNLGNGQNGIAISYLGTATRAMANKPWIVDCVVSNVFHCNYTTYNINLARTMIAYTYGVKHTDGNVNAVMSGGGGGAYVNAIHSVFTNLGDVPRSVSKDCYKADGNTPFAIGDGGDIVNCVFARNMNAVSQGTSYVDNILNSVVTEHYGNSRARAHSICNCVLPSAEGDVATDVAKKDNLYGKEGSLAAPILMDFHPITEVNTVAPAANACVVGQGLASHLDKFPEEYRWTDYYGEKFSADANGKICAGCSQKPIAPTCAFRTSQSVLLDGLPSYNEQRAVNSPGWIYLASNDWPRVFELDWDRSASPKETDVFQYEVGDDSMVKVPNMSGKALFVPRKGMRNLKVAATFPDATYYVSTTGNDSATGTEAAPLKTIQKGVDKASSTYGQRTLIKVLPGDYSDAPYESGDGYYCVGVNKANALIGIRSTAGAETTRIIGAAPTEPDKYGFGKGAVRCVGFFGNCSNDFVQGFTLMNGHCVSTNDAVSAAVYSNDAIGAHPFVAVADCIITNCCGSRNYYGSGGGVMRGVRAVRCKIINNRNYTLGMIGSSHLVNSLVDGVYDLEPSLPYYNNIMVSATIQGSTLVGRDSNSMILPSAHDFFFDTIISDARKFTSNDNSSLYCGIVFANGAGDSDNTRFPEGICRKTVTGDPGFANAAAGNYRLVTTSPAIGWDSWAKLPGYDTDQFVTADKNRSVSATRAHNSYYDNITYDLDGFKPVFIKNKGVAGCYQRPSAARVTILPQSLPADVTVTGLNADSTIPLGATVRLSVSSTLRPVTSVTVNGQSVNPNSFDVTAPAYDPNTTDWKDFTVEIVVETGKRGFAILFH